MPKATITVKIRFSPRDPFDSEVIPVIESQKNKAGFIRKAVFCYLTGHGQEQRQEASKTAGIKKIKKSPEMIQKLKMLSQRSK